MKQDIQGLTEEGHVPLLLILSFGLGLGSGLSGSYLITEHMEMSSYRAGVPSSGVVPTVVG